MRGWIDPRALWSELVPQARGVEDRDWALVHPGAPRPSLSQRPLLDIVAADSAELLRYREILRFLAVTGWPVAVRYRQGTELGWSHPEPSCVAAIAHRDRRGRILDRLGAVDWRPVPSQGSGPVLIVAIGRRAILGRSLHRRADRSRWTTARSLGVAVCAEVATRSAIRRSDVDAVLEASEILDGRDLPELGWSLVLHRLAPVATGDDISRFARAADRCGIDAVRAGISGVLDDTMSGFDSDATGQDGTDNARVLVRRTTAAAARLRAEDRSQQAAMVLAGGLRAMFARSRHVQARQSPLITASSHFLEPIREAERMLRPPRETPTMHSTPDRILEARPGGSALILAGAYPAFARGLQRALGPQTPVLDLGAIERRFHNTEMEATTLHELMSVDSGASATSPAARSLVEAMSTADHIVADWADKGAALASRLIQPGQRLTVRVNGVDHLSSWIHLIRWEHVDNVIYVSEHLRRAVDACQIPGLREVRSRVIPHAVEGGIDPARRALGAEHTLGLIGWAQAVKDPIFALDTLALLRARDPRWRLLLIGPDLDDAGAEEPFRRRVQQRIEAADVRGGVETTGRLAHEQVLELLPRVGYGLSTSLRESLHLGAIEMALSGAVPVIRDWPLYAPLDGAATVFPPGAVVTSAAQAAARIWGLAGDTGAREAAVAEAHDLLQRRHDPDHVARQLSRVVRGEDSPLGPMA